MLHMRSLVGFAIWWYVAFVVLYFLLVRDRTDIERAIDAVVTVLVVSTGLLVAGVLSWMIVFIVAKGASKLTGSFFTHDLSRTGPLTPGGGAKHAIIGTIEQVALATLVVVPVGILTAVYLHEINGRLARPVRFIVDAMSGLPSIVAGLLVFTVIVTHYGFSGISGSVALAILMLPTMTKASEEILRTIPDGLREGALALGSPQWRLVQKVVSAHRARGTRDRDAARDRARDRRDRTDAVDRLRHDQHEHQCPEGSAVRPSVVRVVN